MIEREKERGSRFWIVSSEEGKKMFEGYVKEVRGGRFELTSKMEEAGLFEEVERGHWRKVRDD